MPNISLKYGSSRLSFDYADGRFDVLGHNQPTLALSDVEIGARLDQPIDSKLLEDIIQPDETVLIVVPDATRQTASGQIVNLLVRRLIANGTLPFNIQIIFATGIHRSVTEDEKRRVLTPFIAQRVKTLDHHPRDLAQIIRLGETSAGIPIELNRALIEHDRVIIVGGITFHYFAGFTGGRKLICPGLASSRTIAATHKLAFDCEIKSRRANVDLGVLNKNPVHEAFASIVKSRPPDFAVSTIVNDAGEAVELFCGDWQTSHRIACEAYSASHTVEISEKRDLVIVSAGGVPHDINLIQAHKALETAVRACEIGGTIVLLAECADGLGRKYFLEWFTARDSNELAERLCASYQVNGQTAWNLLRRAEQFDVKIITSLAETETRPMRLQKVSSLNEIPIIKNDGANGYILPFGAKYLIKDRRAESL